MLRLPLLAPSETLTDKTAQSIAYPKLVSGKYDGIRCTIQGGRLISRTLKPLPNKHIEQELASIDAFQGLDGEIVCGSPTMDGGFNYTSSVVMGNLKTDDWMFYVFDCLDREDLTFSQRLLLADNRVSLAGHPKVQMVNNHLVTHAEELLAVEYRYRKAGWEGVMVRDPNGLYPVRHEGELRCTFMQQNILKFKRFEDSEGVILKVYEGETNNNPAFKDERGLLKRSTAKANKVPNGHAGGFLVRDPKFGWDCDVGPGKFTKAQLKWIWENRQQVEGSRVLKYKFQLKGDMTLPRFPVAQGFRDNME